MRMKSKKLSKTAKQKDHKCAGCGNFYTVFGYFYHLCQTSKPECIKVRNSDPHFHWNSPSPPSSPSSSQSSTSPSHSPDIDQATHKSSAQPFNGDFFGKYDGAEFDNYDEYDGGDEDDQEGINEDEGKAHDLDSDEDLEQQKLEEEEEEDALHYQEKNGWEVNADMGARDPPQGMDIDLEGLLGTDEDGTPNPLTTQTSQHQVQDQLYTKTYIDRFSSAQAGAWAY